MMYKFKIDDTIRMTTVDEEDEKRGLHVGSIGVVVENSSVPFCLFAEIRATWAILQDSAVLVEEESDE